MDTDFDSSRFEQLAFFSAIKSRTEMHLKANRDCLVRPKAANLTVTFKKGETIHTENSYKFTAAGTEELVRQAGLTTYERYTDAREWFSLVIMGRKA